MKKYTDTEKKILECAKKLFISDSYENVGLKDIAHLAEVDLALVTQYFIHKEILFDRVFESIIYEFTEKTTVLITPDSSINEIIRKITDSYFDVLLENPGILIFIFSYIHKYKKKITPLSPINGLYNFDFYANLLAEKLNKGAIYHHDITDFFIDMISLISYPFTIQRLISAKHNFDQNSFKEFMLHRKEKIIKLLLLSYVDNDMNCLLVKNTAIHC